MRSAGGSVIETSGEAGRGLRADELEAVVELERGLRRAAGCEIAFDRQRREHAGGAELARVGDAHAAEADAGDGARRSRRLDDAPLRDRRRAAAACRGEARRCARRGASRSPAAAPSCVLASTRKPSTPRLPSDSIDCAISDQSLAWTVGDARGELAEALDVQVGEDAGVLADADLQLGNAALGQQRRAPACRALIACFTWPTRELRAEADGAQVEDAAVGAVQVHAVERLAAEDAVGNEGVDVEGRALRCWRWPSRRRSARLAAAAPRACR